MEPGGTPSLVDLLRHPEQYIQNFPLRGVYFGIVEDSKDPDLLHRVKVRIESLWPTEEVPTDSLPWAYVTRSGGLNETGGADVPEKDTAVMVIFMEGDISYPIVIGSFYGMPNGTSEMPKAARGLPDTASAKKGLDSTTGAAGVVLKEPINPFGAKYPSNHVWRSNAGHLVEYDDTPGKERINVAHKSGTWAEIHPNGSIVVGGQKQLYVFTKDKAQLHAAKNIDLVADVDLTAKAEEDINTDAGGDHSNKAGKDFSIDALQDILMTAARNLTAQIGEAVSVQAGTSTTINSQTGTSITDLVSILLNSTGTITANATGAMSLVTAAAMLLQAAAAMSIKAASVDVQAATVEVTAPLVKLGNVAPAPVVTVLTHPVDYITGLPILGTPVVQAG